MRTGLFVCIDVKKPHRDEQLQFIISNSTVSLGTVKTVVMMTHTLTEDGERHVL